MDAEYRTALADTWQSIRDACEEISRQVQLERDERERLAARDTTVSGTPDDVVNEFAPIILDLEEFEAAVERHDVEEVLEWVSQVQFICDLHEVPIEAWVWEALEEATEILHLGQPTLIFAPPPPKLVVPQLIVSTQQALVSAIKKDGSLVFGLTGREFEELVAELFSRRGYEVELTQTTRDGGRDIIAVASTMNTKMKLLIECKRYAPDRKISIALVQRLYGVKMAERANKAILATTSSFTAPSVAFAQQHVWDLDLKAYEDVMRWIADYPAA